MKVISIKSGTMIYLFFMVIKFCWWAFLCLKCNLIAIAKLGSSCAIETSNLDTDISEMNFGWNDIQTSENMQNLEFLPKNAFRADGYNTKFSERLHIDYAKEGYCASNKWDMWNRWLCGCNIKRPLIFSVHSAYLTWTYTKVKSIPHPSNGNFEDDEFPESEALQWQQWHHSWWQRWYDCGAYMVRTTTLHHSIRLKVRGEGNLSLAVKRGKNECVSMMIGDPKMVRKCRSSKQ